MGSMGVVPRFLQGRLGRTAAASFMLLLLTLSSLSVQAGHVDSNTPPGDGPSRGPIPVLSLRLSPTQMQAQVSEAHLGSVTFDGTATVDQMRITSSMITLQAVVNTGWPVIVNPQTIETTGPCEEEFTVTVIVPPATSALLTGNVMVTGACKAPGLSPVVASCSGVVTVAAYYLLDVSSPDPTVTLGAGEEGTVELQVHNRGNMPVQVTVTPVARNDDITVEVGELAPIDSDEYLSVNVTIRTGSGIQTGAHVVVLRVEPSTQGGVVAYTDFNITVHVPSLSTRLGVSGIATIVVIIGVAVAIAVLFKKGKLDGLRAIMKRKGAPSQ